MTQDIEISIASDNGVSSDSEILALESELVRLIAEFGDKHIDVAKCLNKLADFCRKNSNFEKAEKLYRRLLDIQEVLLGHSHPEIGNSLSSLATSLTYLDRDNLEVEHLLRRVLEIREKSCEPDDIEIGLANNNLAMHLNNLCRYDEAEAFCRRSLEISEKVYGPEHEKTGFFLSNFAFLLVNLGRFAEADLLYHRALDIHEKFYGVDHHEVGFFLTNYAEHLENQGRLTEAEKSYRRALEIHDKSNGVGFSEGNRNLNCLANLLVRLCNYSEAEMLYTRALKLEENGYTLENAEDFETLNNFASMLVNLGRYSEAEPLIRRVMEVSKSSYGTDSLADLLNILGRYSEAESLYRSSLAIFEKEFGTHHHTVSIKLFNLAKVLLNLCRFSEAEALLQRSLDICEKVYGLEHPETAACLNGLAVLFYQLGRYPEAEQLSRRVLQIFERTFDPEHPAVGENLSNLAEVLTNLNRYAEAELLYRQALSITMQHFGSKHIHLAPVLQGYSKLMTRCDKISAGIFLGKQAINILQIARKDVSNIGKTTLDAFDKSIEIYYTSLAELLIKSDRLCEAEYVLGLLKEDEYFEFVRRDGAQAGILSSALSYNFEEAPLNASMDGISITLSFLCARANELKKNKSRTTVEDAEFVDLLTRIEDASREFNEFLDSLHESLGSETAQHVDDATDMMSSLWDLGKETAVIYTLSTKDSFYTILVTRHFRKKYASPTTSEELSNKVLRFRELVTKRDKYDVEPLACELYDMIMGQMADELKDAGITTLLWMLEGPLRLLPVSALHDGTNYIVSKYRNVYLTTKSRENLHSQSKPNWTALGLGVTQAHEHFKALPAVKEELEGIVIHDGSTQGVHPGEILLDGEFTWDTMTNELDGDYQAVHIASHFNLDPCNETMSYLLLGDGSHLTLDKLKNQSAIFRGVDLLAFSACSTGVGTASKRGREIDGIGYIGETQGAKTVMATLWPVADESTSLIMTDFYKRREAGASKIEALRQAQLGMLNGTLKPTKPHTERSAEEPFRFEVDRDKPYAHPYYWAPFILIGNYL